MYAIYYYIFYIKLSIKMLFTNKTKLQKKKLEDLGSSIIGLNL